MKVSCEVMNAPEYAKKCKHIVARYFDHQLWFYGAFDEDEVDRAEQAADELENGILLTNGDTPVSVSD